MGIETPSLQLAQLGLGGIADNYQSVVCPQNLHQAVQLPSVFLKVRGSMLVIVGSGRSGRVDLPPLPVIPGRWCSCPDDPHFVMATYLSLRETVSRQPHSPDVSPQKLFCTSGLSEGSSCRFHIQEHWPQIDQQPLTKVVTDVSPF